MSDALFTDDAPAVSPPPAAEAVEAPPRRRSRPPSAAQQAQRSLYRACKACGKGVHIQSHRCKSCGALSPWPRDPAKKRASRVQDQDKVAAFEVGEVYERHPAPQYVGVTDPGAVPHVATRDIRCVINGAFIFIPAGKVLIEQNAQLIRELLKQQQPIVPTGEVGDVVACPHCRELFKLPPKLRMKQ